MKHYQGSLIAKEIMEEYRERKKWERYLKKKKAREKMRNANKES